MRGRGLMLGLEFTAPDGSPDAATADAVLAESLRRRLLLLNCGSYKNVVRWIPPLIVTEEQLATALSTFSEALAAATLISAASS